MLKGRVGGVADQPAIAYFQHTAAKGGVYLGVRDLHDGGSLAIELLEEFHDLFRLGGVQIAGRFVGEQQGGAVDDGTGNTNQLLLAAGELARVQVFFADDAETIERVCDQ